jgi:DNA primase
VSIEPSANPAELKRTLTDVPAICAALGLDRGARVQPQGLLILCPWHDEKHASCSVRVGADGTVCVKCFACTASGDVLALIAQACGLDIRTQFALVLVEARRIAEHIAAGPSSHTQIHTSVDKKNTSGARARVAEALLAACPLAAAPEACAYLQGRHLLDEALADGWGALPAASTDIISVINKVVVSLGLELWEQSGFPSRRGGLPWMEHRLLIPWRDPAGHVATLQRRLLRPVGDDDEPYVFPRGGAAAWPYGIELVTSADKSIDIAFVEGAMDALALRSLYRKHSVERLVLAVPGVANIRREWAELARGRTVHVAFDRDEAGDVAAIRFAAKLHRVGALRVVRRRPTHGKDWSDELGKEKRRDLGS